MRIRMRLDGSGTRDDPFSVNLPTYTIVTIDAGRRIAIVDVPDADLPGDARVWSHLAVTQNLTDPTPGRMHGTAKGNWHRHLDRRYQEHAGKFRPPLA